MKNLLMMVAASSLFILTAMPAYARDTVAVYSIQEALSDEQAKLKLGTNIKFYFGDQTYGAVEKRLIEFRTNHKTNAFGKSDQDACEWVFITAMIALRDKAVQEGANAVVNIRSNYRNNLTSSKDTFQCGSGAMIAGVALVGEMVKLKD